MSTLFLLLFLASLICLILGLIKPTVFSRFIKNKKEKISRKKIVLIFGVAAFAFLIVFGLTTPATPTKNTDQQKTQESPKEQPKAEVTIYELKAEANATSKDTVEVKGTSNLPDGSIVSVVINRISIWQGEDEERFFRAGFANVTVKDKKFSTSITVDDKKFLEFEKVSGEFIKELNENVEVVFNFDPSSELQPKSVVEIIGAKGEKLENSPQKDVFGSLTSNPINQLEVEIRTKLPFPYTKELPKYIP